MACSWFALALAFAPAVVTAGCSDPSPFALTSSAAGMQECYNFPEIASLAVGPFAIHDNYPMPYFVTAPCHNVTAKQTNCTSFNGGDSAGAPAFAVSGAQCYALGHNSEMSVSLKDPNNVTGGVIVNFSGGVGGRAVQYHLLCDPSAKAGPYEAVEGGLNGYTINWKTAAVCNPVSAKVSKKHCVFG
jgi:hypothetical protein